MPAPAQRFGRPDPRERLLALAGVLLVQFGLGLVLFRGLTVHTGVAHELVSHLIQVTLPPPPPPPPIPPKPVQRAKVVPKHEAAAPAPREPNPGGSPGPAPHGNAILPKIALPAPAAAAAGGGRGTGASIGSGSGGGAGDSGDGEGGTDLEKIAGDVYGSDYPRNLVGTGIGGRVSVTIGVGTDGRVTSCRVTRSSGNAELDSVTCRLIQQRYRFRPSTDRYGRPVPDEADVDQDWVAPR